MNPLSLITITVFAAEVIVSPLPDVPSISQNTSVKPLVTFGSLITSINQSANVLGVTFPTPTPTPTRTRKSEYSIAILGDSMVDTLGPEVQELKSKLLSRFPVTSFTILNYGVGGTNIDYGLKRLTSDYTYLDKSIPALVSKHPDIVIVESFGYNPYSYNEGALETHWLSLAHIVDTLHDRLPDANIVIAATIAPNAKVFGDGALNLTQADKWQRTDIIKKYLESTVAFAKSQKLPVADAFHASLDANGNGKISYINGGDHIHYSDAGRQLFAEKVAEAILANRLLE